jgi:hypothetical protein
MSLTLSDFSIFANSANKRQTSVTINHILTQKWFLSTSEHKRFIIESYFRNGVFNNGRIKKSVKITKLRVT